MRLVETNDSAASVFALLSDETRVDVLRAVAVEREESAGPGCAELTFSEIYERVDVDNTSKLSYHLGELTGTFLRKRESEYSFTYAGERMARFVLSRNHERPPDFGPEPTSGRCPFCGSSPLRATIDHRLFRVECPACDRPVTGHPVTPAQVRSREPDALLESIKRKQATDYARIRRGLCPQCDGRLATRVTEVPAGEQFDAESYLAVDDCESCLRRYNAPLTYSVAYHPASVAFHWDHGVDVTARALWEFHDELYEGRWTSERVATDPDEYRVVLRHGDDALRVDVDSEVQVTRTERVRRTGCDDEQK